MTELDLDALERFIRGHPINGEESKAIARNVAVLIQRLREAEGEVEKLRGAGLVVSDLARRQSDRLVLLERVRELADRVTTHLLLGAELTADQANQCGLYDLDKALLRSAS